MEKFNLDDHFNRFKLDNIERLYALGAFVYILMSVIDYSLIQKDFSFFLLNRTIAYLPYTFIFLFRKRIQLNQVDFWGMVLFIGMVSGVSHASYRLGGLTSDYYYGVVIVSFVQFLVMPLNTTLTIVMEFFYISLYFPVNFLPFDFPPDLLTKQLSNFVTFSILKIALAGRFRKHLLGSFEALELNKVIEKKETVQLVLGELCHLLNNPLFISTSVIKKIQRDKDLKNDPDFEKALEANDRMSKILREMLELQEKGEVDLQNDEFLRNYFKDQDLKHKKVN